MSQQASAIGHQVDVAVIGSGFGGAAVACRLAQAGKKVAILERGKQYPTGRFDYEATGHGVATNRCGHFWVDIGVGINVIRGIGVGGGSLHYFGVRLRTHPDIFENPRWPRSINRKVLGRYPVVEAIQGTRQTTVSATNPYQLGYVGMGTDAANEIPMPIQQKSRRACHAISVESNECTVCLQPDR
jgi:hypothetical protein